MALEMLRKKIYSTQVVTTPMITIPVMSASICFIDSFGSSSLSRSGRTVTRPMCKNVPAVKGRIHEVLASVKDHANIILQEI